MQHIDCDEKCPEEVCPDQTTYHTWLNFLREIGMIVKELLQKWLKIHPQILNFGAIEQ